MKKTLASTIIIALIFIFSCKVTVPILDAKVGCWWEEGLSREVCGVAEEYSTKDSTYVMRTNDGWAMRLKAEKIKWK